MGLTGIMTCALCAFLLAQDARAPPPSVRRWMLTAWALCALAVLTKGIIGVVLPALAVAAYMAMQRDVALLRRLHIGAGLLVLAVITLPWFIAAEMRNPGFAEFFFVREHWQRFTQPLHRRTGPWWYFVPIAASFLLPWLPAIVASSTRSWRTSTGKAGAGFDARRFVWCCAGAIFVFFSLSSSKLPAYIMPAMGAIALAVAVPLARRWDATVRMTAWTAIGCGVMAAIAAIPAMAWIKVPLLLDAYAANVGWLFGSAFVFALAGGAALRFLQKGRRLRALATLVLGILLACQLGTVLAYRIDGYFSAERLIDRVARGARPFQPDVPFYSVDMFDHTVPFYLGRNVILVKEQSELEWGIAAAPQNFIEDVGTFANRWRLENDAYAIMPPATYDWLQKTGLPMRFVDSDGRRVVVARR
jgi:4-amino-4-deoxy-L-arabinose transferase-like glycosyltransferase